MIKETDKLHDIPIIVMVTAYDREEVMKQIRGTEIDAFLVKPVIRSLLFNTIMKIVSKDIWKSAALAIRRPKENKALPMFHGVSVLLVEDNETNQQVAGELMEHAGLKVDTANNGIEAVQAVVTGAYHAVFMDIQMPKMDGFEATRIIRRNTKYQQLPIIALTAHAMTGEKDKCLDAGMTRLPLQTHQDGGALRYSNQVYCTSGQKNIHPFKAAF